MQKTTRVMFDNNGPPEIKLGTLLVDKNENVWIIYSQQNIYTIYFNIMCITASLIAKNLYCDTNLNINSDMAYKSLTDKGFKVLIGSVTITQK